MILDFVMDRARDLRFRGKARLARLLPKGGSHAANVFGANMRLDLSDYIERHAYAGSYEPLNVHRFRRILRPGDTVVDVGANIGVFTVLAAQRVGPTGRVVAIEPHPDNARALRETVQRNRLEQVTVVECALDECAGTGRIASVPHDLFPVRTAIMMPDRGTEVRTMTLDALVAELELTRIDLLKIDVDGYETKVLRGASNALRSTRHAIVELVDHWIGYRESSVDEIIGMIAAGGLREEFDSLAAFFFGPCPDRVFSRSTVTLLATGADLPGPPAARLVDYFARLQNGEWMDHSFHRTTDGRVGIVAYWSDERSEWCPLEGRTDRERTYLVVLT